jgi:hypothetical protein
MAGSIREVVAVFDDAETLERAVYDLETHGFDRAAFSVLASEHAVERKLGQRYRRIEEMEDNPKAPRETFFSRVSQLEAEYGLAPALALIAAAGAGLGTTAAALPILVAAGGGAAVGAVLGRLIHRHHAGRLQEQLERGGLLLWVNVRGAEEERKAVAALTALGAGHIHAHDVAAWNAPAQGAGARGPG